MSVATGWGSHQIHVRRRSDTNFSETSQVECGWSEFCTKFQHQGPHPNEHSMKFKFQHRGPHPNEHSTKFRRSKRALEDSVRLILRQSQARQKSDSNRTYGSSSSRCSTKWPTNVCATGSLLWASSGYPQPPTF